MDGALGAGTDRTGRQFVLGRAREDHAAVAPVAFRSESRLAPLEAHEGHQIGVAGVAGHVVALAHAFLGGGPVVGEQRLRVIGEGEEVEVGAVACEVAGVGGWMCALATDQRQREQEAVPRVGGVNVKVAEQDLFFRRLGAGGDIGGCRPLPRQRLRHDLPRLRRAFDRHRFGRLAATGGSSDDERR